MITSINYIELILNCCFSFLHAHLRLLFDLCFSKLLLSSFYTLYLPVPWSHLLEMAPSASFRHSSTNNKLHTTFPSWDLKSTTTCLSPSLHVRFTETLIGEEDYHKLRTNLCHPFVVVIVSLREEAWFFLFLSCSSTMRIGGWPAPLPTLSSVFDSWNVTQNISEPHKPE